MHFNSIAAAPALGMAVLLSACSSSSPTYAVSYAQYRFTCCANSDLQQPWHAGETMTLHWVSETAGATSDSVAHPIVLTAVLTGPYASVALVKAGGSHALGLAAAPLAVNDRTSSNQVSSIALPTDLAAGWYNLAFAIASNGGNAVRSATIIEVTRANS